MCNVLLPLNFKIFVRSEKNKHEAVARLCRFNVEPKLVVTLSACMFVFSVNVALSSLRVAGNGLQLGEVAAFLHKCSIGELHFG